MTSHTPSSGAPRRAPRRGAPRRGGSPAGAPRQAESSDQGTPSSFDLNAVMPHAEPTTTDFAELGVPAPIIAALVERGVTSAFPIQAATLPDSLAGRDVLGRGKTGSGKTIAFAIPTVVALANSGHRRDPSLPRALVLVPTRELANQVAESIAPLAKAMSMRVAVVFGGVGQTPQVNQLRAGVDILVACPGRLEDLMQQRHVRLDRVEVTVLDEADHMADLGFLPGVKRILDATPTNAQRLLFSATLDNGIDVLVKRYLTNPIVHSVDPGVSPVSTMTHHVLAVSAADKLGVVTALASGMDRSLLFMRTKHGAKKLAKQLSQSGIPAVELHGNLSQNARERNLESFSTGTTRVLVATDIAARGIHVDEIALVVHVDPPAEHKAYLHRSGRTARAGASGVVITVMTPDQAGDVRSLARAAKITPIVTQATPSHALILELAGPSAPKVAPSAAPAPQMQQRSSRPASPGGARSGAGRPAAGRPAAGRPGDARGARGRTGGTRQRAR